MSRDVDAVIAALRIVLQEVERQTWVERFETHVVDQWIDQLPGAWRGRWNNLLLKPTTFYPKRAYREEVLTHLRATLAYLEVNRDQMKRKLMWPWGGRARKPKPIDAEFKEVADLPVKPAKKAGKSVRLIRG